MLNEVMTMKPITYIKIVGFHNHFMNSVRLEDLIL